MTNTIPLGIDPCRPPCDWPVAMDLWVPGIPAPGGSKKHVGGGRMVDAGKNNAPWRSNVASYAEKMWGDRPLLDQPIAVYVEFVRLRPKIHLNTKGLVKPKAPSSPISKPDATKLWRAAEDALTGIVWADDSRIVDERVTKSYGEKPGMFVRVMVEPTP